VGLPPGVAERKGATGYAPGLGRTEPIVSRAGGGTPSPAPKSELTRKKELAVNSASNFTLARWTGTSAFVLNALEALKSTKDNTWRSVLADEMEVRPLSSVGSPEGIPLVPRIGIVADTVVLEYQPVVHAV
jgi:hypothetical protein